MVAVESQGATDQLHTGLRHACDNSYSEVRLSHVTGGCSRLLAPRNSLPRHDDSTPEGGHLPDRAEAQLQGWSPNALAMHLLFDQSEMCMRLCVQANLFP